MRAQNTVFRLAAPVAIAAIVLGPALSGAYAQAPPPPDQAANQGANQPEVTPPLRVGRLAWTQGTVSFHTADQDNWSPAVVNYPVTTGDAFWTQPDAQAGIQVSDVLIAMSPATELDVDTLDDTSFAATEPQGEVYVRVGSLTAGESYTLQTPRGTVTIATPGRYEIAAGTTEAPTRVTVLEGAARVSGAQQLDVGPGQAAVITGDQTFQAQLQPAARDSFLDAMLARERPATAARAPAPPAVAQMPGGAELSEYGNWSSNPQYGQVWYPQVASGWVPYREGHWAYVAPWGWTWIDSDPWGFAPFHYGRWVDIDGRWAWIPGEVAVAEQPQPVYAPALVAFFGFGAGLAAGAAFGGSVGWCPLGPGEVWHPWFRASPTYLRRVNLRNVTNVTNINTTVNNITINRFRNARAATVVPATAMMTSRPVRDVARAARPQELAQVRPVIGRQPVRPTTATLGVTPAVARQMHIGAPPAGVAAAPRRAAPGPAIRTQAASAQPGQRHERPALRNPGTPTGVAATPRSPAGVPTEQRAGAPGTVVAPGGRERSQPPGLAHAAPALRPPTEGHAGPPPIQHEAGRNAGPAAPHEPTRAGEQPRAAEAARAPSALQPHAAGSPEPGLRAPPESHPESHQGVAHAAPQLRTPHEPPPAVGHAPARPDESRVTTQVPHPGAVPPREAPRQAAMPRPAPPPHPAPELHAAAPPVMHTAAPPVHEPPRPAPEMRAAARPPAPPPVAHPPPQPAAPPVHEAPRPAPEMHAARPPEPPPVAHPPPRPAAPPVHEAPRPAPEMHAAAAPPHPAPQEAPHPQQHQQKRPGQQ